MGFLERLARVFPARYEQWWKISDPSAAIPNRLKVALRLEIAKMFPAQDASRMFLPTRQGFSSRPFLTGDPFISIDRHALINQNKLLTKTERQDARQNICILWICSEAMEFPSESNFATPSGSEGSLSNSMGTDRPNKGQVTLAIIAVLQAIHSVAQHKVQVLMLTPQQLNTPWQKSHKANFHSCDQVYVLSDFLFDPSHLSGGATSFLQNVPPKIFSKSFFVIVRDLLESLETNNPLLTENIELFGPVSLSSPEHISGSGYREKLEAQRKEYENIFLTTRGFVVLTSFFSLAKFLSKINVVHRF